VKFAPTPMNTQALRIEFVRTAEGNRVKSASASAVAILSFDPNFHAAQTEFDTLTWG